MVPMGDDVWISRWSNGCGKGDGAGEVRDGYGKGRGNSGYWGGSWGSDGTDGGNFSYAQDDGKEGSGAGWGEGAGTHYKMSGDRGMGLAGGDGLYDGSG